MKYSKAALKARHVQLGHMTMMQPTAYAEEKSEYHVRPRVYSTDRQQSTNNGIVIPHQLRDRIEASMPPVTPETKQARGVSTTNQVFMTNPWGFL